MATWGNYHENKVRHVFLKDIADTIFKNHGIIFGGYVRDMIIHDHFASEYYKKMEEIDHANTYSLAKYNDATVLPEFIDRLKLPKDIDAFMTTKSFNELMYTLTQQSKKYKVISRNVEVSPYFINPPAGLKHEAILIKLVHNPLYINHIPASLYEMEVKVDVLHMESIPRDIEPPFSIDYECNALIMDSETSFRICKLLYRQHGLIGPLEHNSKLQDIIKDIIERRATPSHRHDEISLFRTKRMVGYGWTPTHPYAIEA
jgi:hypothetical protein